MSRNSMKFQKMESRVLPDLPNQILAKFSKISGTHEMMRVFDLIIQSSPYLLVFFNNHRSKMPFGPIGIRIARQLMRLSRPDAQPKLSHKREWVEKDEWHSKHCSTFCAQYLPEKPLLQLLMIPRNGNLRDLYTESVQPSKRLVLGCIEADFCNQIFV